MVRGSYRISDGATYGATATAKGTVRKGDCEGGHAG